jgi:hypothetical protein
MHFLARSLHPSSVLTQSLSRRPHVVCELPQLRARGDRLSGVPDNSCRCVIPWGPSGPGGHCASGSAVSWSRRVTGMAFPSVFWRHTEPPGAVRRRA